MRPRMMQGVVVDGRHLSLEQVAEVAHGAAVSVAHETRASVEKGRALVEDILRTRRVVYGVTTGFGQLADVFIPPEQAQRLQRNLIRSHAAGVGPRLARTDVRAMLVCRLNALLQGNSGVRWDVIEILAAMLNHDVVPVVPSQGSVGASGDLAPLAHIALALMGEGSVEFRGTVQDARAALTAAGLEPLQLEAKEGLALINGTQLICGVGSLALVEAERLVELADLVGSLTLQALIGIPEAFSDKILKLRPHPGVLRSGERLRRYLEGSALTTRQGEVKVQDPYSLRCMPQVHGAVREALAYVRQALSIEVNSVTDNPLLFPDDGDVLSGGNFHGQPVALPLDTLGMAMAELASISERRIERMVNPSLSWGLPPFLATDPGLSSGLMIAQYTAASVVSENKVLAHPASVDSIPTSAGQEDFVSMGATAARKARRIVQNARRVLAIELLTAAQAAELRGAQRLSPTGRMVYEICRRTLPSYDDGVLSQYIEVAEGVLQSDELLQMVRGGDA